MERRAAFRSLVSTLFILGISVTVVVMIFRGTNSSSSSDHTTINEDSIGYQATAVNNSGAYTPSPQLISNDIESSPELTNDMQGFEVHNTQSQLSEDTKPIPNNLRTDQVADAVMVVMHKALESGEAQNWESGKGDGYVVPSTEQAYPGLICRNVYVAINYRGEKSQSPPQRWCRSAEGDDWTIVP